MRRLLPARFSWPYPPRTLLLFDAGGATLTAVLLHFLLIPQAAWFGFPVAWLARLFWLPVLFVIFDCTAYFLPRRLVATALRTIAVANAGYCLLSLAMVLLHAPTVTFWGWAFVLGEALVISVLIRLEWTAAARATTP